MITYSQNFWTYKNFRTHFFIHQIETDCSPTKIILKILLDFSNYPVIFEYLDTISYLLKILPSLTSLIKVVTYDPINCFVVTKALKSEPSYD